MRINLEWKNEDFSNPRSYFGTFFPLYNCYDRVFLTKKVEFLAVRRGYYVITCVGENPIFENPLSSRDGTRCSVYLMRDSDRKLIDEKRNKKEKERKEEFGRFERIAEIGARSRWGSEALRTNYDKEQ